jgi:hypothetical protein
VVTIVDNGYEEYGKPSPCYRWCGKYRDCRPVLYAMDTSYSPTHLITGNNGKSGATYTSCGDTSCVRPEHVMILTHSILGRRGQGSDKRNQARRDEKGRYVAYS